MTKFNVGDKVRVIAEDHKIFKKGHIFKVAEVDSLGDVYDENGICVLKTRLELKPTKSQRITALENEVAALKLIVHELLERPQLTTIINNSIQGLSATNTVEDIIEFEGQQYRKVDRLALEGDVVVFEKSVKFQGTEIVTKGKLYKAKKGTLGELAFVDNQGDSANVYDGGITKFTPENVAVYELIKPKPKLLTKNQQRAEIIEKAKKFVEETEKYLKQPEADRTKGNYIYQESSSILEFVINEEKRTIVALLYNKYHEKQLNGKGIAKCDPNDVFNQHIGKAIALGRALGLDVSEFEQAVQPSGVVSGMKIKSNYKGDIF